MHLWYSWLLGKALQQPRAARRLVPADGLSAPGAVGGLAKQLPDKEWEDTGQPVQAAEGCWGLQQGWSLAFGPLRALPSCRA